MLTSRLLSFWLVLVLLVGSEQTSAGARPRRGRGAVSALASTAAKASSDENGDLVLDDDITLDDGIDVDNAADDLMVDVQIKPGAVGTASATSRAAGESASGENTDNTPVIHYGVAETPEVMIVGTVDGEVHGVRVEDGEKLWTTDEVGGPTIKSFQAPSFKGGVVPGDDGQLYIFSEEEDDLSLHPLSIPDLVNSCPLTDTLGGEEGEIRVVGQRKTSYYEIDPNTGRRLRVFTSDTGSLLNGRWEIVGDSQPPELSNKDVHFPDASPLTIGRVDYHVRAYNAVSGLEVWNFTYGQFLSRDRDVPRLSSRNLEIDTAMSQRATWEGVPVTAVFGVSRAQSSKKSWRFLSEVSIGNEGQAVIGNLPKAKPIYLQRIKYKSGHVQVYATTSRPGRDIRCSNAVFPEDIGYRSSDAGVAGVAMDQEQCTVVDEDFPLQGPYHVTDQHLIYGDADDITDSPVDSGRVTKSSSPPRWPGLGAPPTSRGLPSPGSGTTNHGATPSETPRHTHFDPPGYPPAPMDAGRERTLQTVIGALLILVLVLLASRLNLIRRHKRGSAQELEVQYDPATETERVGQLTVQLDSVLGRGCHGTTVLKGRLRDRPVAVKKVVASQFQLAKKEIDLLIRSDGHSNVVRYFTQEETREFIYLALELCDFTLEKAVESIRDLNRSRRELVPKSAKKNVRLPDTTIAFLHSLADATKHLHSLCIVHCDIKPQNILVIETKKVDAAKAEVAEGSWDPSAISSGAPGPSVPASSPTSLVTGAMTVSVSSVSASSGTLVEAESQGSRSVGGSSYLAGLGEFFEPKLSDMGLGRKFSGTTSSIYGGTSMHGSGTVGWRAPELLSSLRSKGDAELERDVAIRCGRKVDVFSMGCVFFYVVSNGFHPFGDAIEREKNIMDDAPVNLGRIKNYPEAQDLIGQMIRHDAQLRPSIEECMEHPLLWPASRKLEFLKHVSDRLELDRVVEDRASGSDPRPFSVPESTLHERFEEYAREVFGSQGWLQRLHPSLRNDVVDSKRRYYTTHSLRDLLRYMRNKYSHIRESTPEVRDLLSPLPDRFLDEFIGSNRFPKLLMSCHRFILEFCAHEPEFAEILGPFTVAKYGPDAAACAKRAKEAPAGSEKFGTLSPSDGMDTLTSVAEGTESERPFRLRPQCVMDSLGEQQGNSQSATGGSSSSGKPPKHGKNKQKQSAAAQQTASIASSSRPARYSSIKDDGSLDPDDSNGHLPSTVTQEDILPPVIVEPPPGFEDFPSTSSDPATVTSRHRSGSRGPPPGFETSSRDSPSMASSSSVTGSPQSRKQQPWSPPPRFPGINDPIIAPPHLFNSNGGMSNGGGGGSLSSAPGTRPRRNSQSGPGSAARGRSRSPSPSPLSSSPPRGSGFASSARAPRDNWRGPHAATQSHHPRKPRYTGDPKADPHYKTKLCRNWESSNGTDCFKGDQCFFAHGESELRPKPDESTSFTRSFS